VRGAGALLMGWPRPWLTGAGYGLLCAVMALIGDLTVSLLKRSAGFKDTCACGDGCERDAA
jgi:phosphatidate cytidylyltransferase